MKIAVIDCSVSGHRETYYKEFTLAWASLGHDVLLCAPRASGTEQAATFVPIDTRPLRPLPVGQPIRKKLTVLHNACIRLQNLSAISRQIGDFHPDLVYFPCLDDLLPTLDNLDLALQYGSKDEACKDMLQGVAMTRKLLLEAVARHGLTPVGTAGEAFTPELHEAVGFDAEADVEAGAVARVLQSGYKLGERLLRPAKVMIKQG